MFMSSLKKVPLDPFLIRLECIFASVHIILMESKRERPVFAVPQHAHPFSHPLDQSSTSNAESFFCKYASSVYETIPEEGLDGSKRGQGCLIEESVVNEYNMVGNSQTIPCMKKKPALTILTYNFRNLESLVAATEALIKRKTA